MKSVELVLTGTLQVSPLSYKIYQPDPNPTRSLIKDLFVLPAFPSSLCSLVNENLSLLTNLFVSPSGYFQIIIIIISPTNPGSMSAVFAFALLIFFFFTFFER